MSLVFANVTSCCEAGLCEWGPNCFDLDVLFVCVFDVSIFVKGISLDSFWNGNKMTDITAKIPQTDQE